MEWRSLAHLGYPNYEVSSDGGVRNTETGREVRRSYNGRGIAKVGLIKKHAEPQHTASIARLVAELYLPLPPNESFDTPIHLNGDRSDCRADNLMWRPRWFAVRYHRQFKRPLHAFSQPIVCVDTDDVFDDCRQAAMAFGMLEREIFLDVTNQVGVWPHHFTFQLLDDNYWDEE